MAALKRRKEDHKAHVESEKEALEKAYEGRTEILRIVINWERVAVLEAEAVEAERKSANQIRSPEQQHILDRMQNLGVAEK